jgi:hypothetical protein
MLASGAVERVRLIDSKLIDVADLFIISRLSLSARFLGFFRHDKQEALQLD